MANTITNLIPILYESLDVVSRELVGYIAAVSRNSGAERAAVNETVTYPVVPAIATQSVSPGVTAPDDGNATIGTATMTITKSKYAPIRWNGEEYRALSNNNTYRTVVRDQFAQAMRALVNEVELDCHNEGYKNSSRAVGAAGTPPFNSAGVLTDASYAFQVLDDNGAPAGDRHMVLGTAAMANIRGKQSVLFKVNEAGTSDLLRRGIIGELMGFALHNSAAPTVHTKGTGTGYVFNGSHALGVTSIVAKTGANTVVAGDVLAFEDDANNKYVVNTGIGAPGTLVIGETGLRQAQTDGKTITVGGNYTPNLAFTRNALHLVTRTPSMPEGGDMADDVFDLTDPVSGLTFQVAVYRQYRQVRWEVGLAWGVKAVKREHIATIMG
jgi:P22 coat protein - gene protein 5